MKPCHSPNQNPTGASAAAAPRETLSAQPERQRAEQADAAQIHQRTYFLCFIVGNWSANNALTATRTLRERKSQLTASGTRKPPDAANPPMPPMPMTLRKRGYFSESSDHWRETEKQLDPWKGKLPPELRDEVQVAFSLIQTIIRKG